jgi:hypothetical protein|tara:strand:+ start:151 stop:417 length:267 start_codon:yes stop_codon:yes gene_type:complete
MEIEDQLKKAREVEQLLWKSIESYLETDKDIVMTSAVLIRIALSLYTVILPDDEDVEKIAIQGIKTIPDLRKLMRRELNGISESNTIH